MIAVTSSRVSSVRSEPPINFEPRLGTTIGTAFSSGSDSRRSLAERQA